MGVSQFFKLLGLREERRHISEFPGWRIGLDGTGFFCQGLYSAASNPGSDPTDAVVNGMEILLKKMIRYGVKPVLFLDGGYLPAKSTTQLKRRNARKRRVFLKLQYFRLKNDWDGYNKYLAKSKSQ